MTHVFMFIEVHAANNTDTGRRKTTTTTTTRLHFELRDQLRWIYSLLSSGCVSSAPTLPSTGVSVFRETGTNREVSGGFGEELFDETFLLQTTAPAWCGWCKKTEPGDTWQLRAVQRTGCALMRRWSRENRDTQRLTDIAARGLYPGGQLRL